MAEIPTPDFAVPYAAPKQVKTMAEVQPMAPKKGYSITNVSLPRSSAKELPRVGRFRNAVIASPVGYRRHEKRDVPHIRD